MHPPMRTRLQLQHTKPDSRSASPSTSPSPAPSPSPSLWPLTPPSSVQVSFLSFNQSMFWISFSPIAGNAKEFYHVDDNTIGEKEGEEGKRGKEKGKQGKGDR